jgi:hypothetical protein
VHSYEQGDLVICQTSIVASGAQLVNPGVVTFIARDPAGNLAASSAASLSHPATGIYYYALPIPIGASYIGNWTYGFRATGGGFQGATPDTVFAVKATALDG